MSEVIGGDRPTRPKWRRWDASLSSMEEVWLWAADGEAGSAAVGARCPSGTTQRKGRSGTPARGSRGRRC